MAALAEEMKHAIVLLGGERRWTDTRQSWLARAARKAGITPRAAHGLFYTPGLHEPRASTVEKVRRAVASLTDEAVVSDKYEELVSRIARLEAALAARQDGDRVDAADGR